MAKSTGNPVDLGPSCPVELLYLWEWFREIYFFEPLSFTEIKSWSELTHKYLRDWEARLIYELSRYV